MTARPPATEDRVEFRRASQAPRCPFCNDQHSGACLPMLAEAKAATARMPEARLIARLPKVRLSTRAQLLAGTCWSRPSLKPRPAARRWVKVAA